jgi:hypothetical protein
MSLDYVLGLSIENGYIRLDELVEAPLGMETIKALASSGCDMF